MSIAPNLVMYTMVRKCYGRTGYCVTVSLSLSVPSALRSPILIGAEAEQFADGRCTLGESMV